MGYRRLAFLIPVTIVAASLGGCSDDADGRTTDPPASPSSTSPPTSAPTDQPGGPPAGWEGKFTEDQLRTYQLALSRWERYTTLSSEIYRKGKDTPEARATIKEYSALWQRDVVTLAEVYDQGGVREEVSPEPLWTYARVIKPTYIVMVQCTDYTNLRITKKGKVLDNKPKHLVTPLVIEMGKPEGKWLFSGSTLKDKVSCAA